MTIKQQTAINNSLENGGNITQAMRDAKYSENTINNPSNLTESKAWQERMAEYLPDDNLFKVHQEGLESNRVISAMKTDKEADGSTSDFIEVPDYATRHRYLETAYKLKRYLQDKALFDIGEGGKLVIEITSYGENDPIKNPIQLSSDAIHDSGVGQPKEISGSQLAQEGKEDNTSNKPVDQMGS